VMAEIGEGLRIPRPILIAPPSSLSAPPSLPDLPPCLDSRPVCYNSNSRRLTKGNTTPIGMTRGISKGPTTTTTKASVVGVEDYMNPPNTCRLPPGAISPIGSGDLSPSNRRWTGQQIMNNYTRIPNSPAGPSSSSTTTSTSDNSPLRRLPRASGSTNGWMSSALSSPPSGPSLSGGSTTWRGNNSNKGFGFSMFSTRGTGGNNNNNEDISSPIPAPLSSAPIHHHHHPSQPLSSTTSTTNSTSHVSPTNAIGGGKPFYNNRPGNYKKLVPVFNYSKGGQLPGGVSRSFSNGPPDRSPTMSAQPSPGIGGMITARTTCAAATTPSASATGSYSRSSRNAASAAAVPRLFHSRSAQFAPAPGFSAASHGTPIHKAHNERSHSGNRSTTPMGNKLSFGFENPNGIISTPSHNEVKAMSVNGDVEADDSPYDQIPLTKDDPVQAAHRAASKSSSVQRNDMGSSVASPMKSLIIRSLIILQETPDYDHQPPTIVVNPRRKRITKPCIKKRAPSTPTPATDENGESIVLPDGWTKNEFGLISIKTTERRRKVTFDYMPKVMPFRGGELVEELIA